MKGPSISTVYNWIEKEKFPRFEEFLKIKNTNMIVEFWKNIFAFKKIRGILSVDAMKVDEDLCIDHKNNIDGIINKKLIKIPENIRGNYQLYSKIFDYQLLRKNIASNIFVISLCPLCNIKCFPLHVYLSSSSSADKYIINYLFTVPNVLKTAGVEIIGISTDSDPAYRKIFNDFFCAWSKSIITSHGDISKISLNRYYITNDCPHLLKRARARLVTKGTLFANRDDWITWKKCISKNLNTDHIPCITQETLIKLNNELNPCWFRNNGHDSMDDFYPHLIFSSSTFKKAYEKGDKYLILFITPILCLIRILRDNNESRKQRLKWSYISLFIFLGYLGWLKVQCTNGKEEKMKEDFPSLFTMDFCIDASNYLFSVIQILGKVDDGFSIGRIGTTASEHFFARLRYEAGKEQTIRSIKKAFNRIILIEKMGNQNQKINHRIFSSARLEQSSISLDHELITFCIYTAKTICEDAGIKFTRDSAYYEIMECIESNLDLNKAKMFVEREMKILSNEYATGHRNQTTKQWRMQISQIRRSNKAGRNIRSRMYTAIKSE